MINYTLYKIGQFLAIHLPVKVAYTIACFISDIRSIFALQDRRDTEDNLRVIFPETASCEIRSLRRKMSHNFATYLVDFFRIPRMDQVYVKKHVRFQNLEYLTDALSKGKGVIVVTAHLGNWELGAATLALLGFPVCAVALTHTHKKVNDFFVSQRRHSGVRVVPLGKAVRQCLAALRHNEIVALVGDRDFAERGMVVEFFGRPTLLPEGPAVFSLLTGASILPVFFLKNQGEDFILTLGKPINYVPCGDRHRDTLALVNRYKVIFEEYIRRYPDQWYMFRKFWI